MGIFSGIFKGRSTSPVSPTQSDFSYLKTDVHSHLIPGIDDGVKTLEESIEMLTGLVSLGFTKAITTPHIMSDCYRNTPEIIMNGLEKVKNGILEAGLPIMVEAAAEYYLDHGFIETLSSKKPLLTFGGKHVLFEVSYINPPDSINETVFELRMQGYQPVLAHPERYPYWYGDFGMFEKLREQGVMFQLNSNSLCGYYGPPAKKCAEKMIELGMIDFMGSDMHGIRHLEALKRTVHEKYYWKLAERGLLNGTL
ncbi:MAG: tyrosine-protein phosphatase [Bacteroidota bacterium]